MKLVHIYQHAEARQSISLCRTGFHPDLLVRYAEMGIIELDGDSISFSELCRLIKILRLRQNCGVNMVGAAIIADLLEKIENLQEELHHARRTSG